MDCEPHTLASSKWKLQEEREEQSVESQSSASILSSELIQSRERRRYMSTLNVSPIGIHP